ncbi:MAG: anthranilate phosphoribosyltransferase, partial [Pseudomonadota bacterium]
MIKSLLAQLRNGKTLTTTEIQYFLNEIISGHVSLPQTGAFLMALAQRGETTDEILGAAQTLRAHVIPIAAPHNTMDCCGTGGDHANTLNISTAVAFVLAGCGIPIAKHGSRAASSQSGAADVLEALGINLDLSPEQCTQALQQFGYCFLMAPHYHHVLKPLAAIRKELGFRTLFNALGPLANPARTLNQLIGVYRKDLLIPFARVLKELGSHSALIVHGSDGLDEITLTGSTHYAFLKNGTITEGVFTPDDFGLSYIKSDDIRGSDAVTNASALTALLDGQPSAYRDVVLA